MATCGDCGKSFDTKRGKNIHHSKAHKEQQTITCERCGKIEQVPPSASDNRFCSRSCKSEWLGEHLSNRVQRKCSNCGDTVARRRSVMEDKEHVFCNNGCMGEFKRKPIERECYTCGNKVVRHPSNNPDKTFCSEKCQMEWWSRRVKTECDYCGDVVNKPASAYNETGHNFCDSNCYSSWRLESDFATGKNNGSWKGGVNHYYGENWRRKRREAIERDNERCQLCGKHRDNLSRDLHVHHIRPIRKYDEVEEANKLSNLVSLCTGCHNVWEGIPVKPTLAGD